MYERNPLTGTILQVLTEELDWRPGDLSHLLARPGASSHCW